MLNAVRISPAPGRATVRLLFFNGFIVSSADGQPRTQKNRGTSRPRGNRTPARSEGETRYRRHTVYNEPETTAPWVTRAEPSGLSPQVQQLEIS